ncbi:aminopeptidase P family protein [Oceanotoga sp. DSM 15011]|uniref:aminopeptidase P family protein n=1 Tax=Oceanotoga sp. DSM 15011 TaxID=2984951 RepID=UPI0021F4972E|nr:aminopeptidase P family protein [Oceanotoga sp. DSM 15011]UYO99395.1 aminopeptidase P family protein [Oceanotoga sp. DSM 15011]
MIKERLKNIRKLMQENEISAYIVPSFDAHKSEYVAEYWKCREFITGFTGSAGTAVILKEKAGLWTDGRYFIQAEKQLKSSTIELFKMGEPDTPDFKEWIFDNLEENSKIGFDGRTFSLNEIRELKNTLDKKNIELIYDIDLIDKIWNDRPIIPNGHIMDHDIKFAGKSRTEKKKEVLAELKKRECDSLLLSSLDDIAWLLNLRGHDVNNNPVFYSYCFLNKDSTILFVDKEKISNELIEKLEYDGIKIDDYIKIFDFVKNLKSKKIFIDPDKTSYLLYMSINKNIKLLEDINITTLMKSKKNEIEIKNLKKSHIRDGIYMVKFLKWIDESEKTELDEIKAQEKLINLRSKDKYSKGSSFDYISAYKENAAMMHYKATKNSNKKFENKGFYLLDSGEQYLDGTTDITRTIKIGELTETEKRDYTLVLKAMINLSMGKFLYGCTGTNLDILARRPIWEYGLDYKCGTGHGIGFFLNVHEGPHGIRTQYNKYKLEDGMIVTNEPGIYIKDSHGIRIENTLLVKKSEKTEFGQFMKFETITVCPIDTRPIIKELMSKEEIKWLNDFHKNVYDKLEEFLTEDEKEWLKNATNPL